MSSRPLPDADPPVPPEDLRQAGAWLAWHGLADARPTPLLATRLAVRRRARLAGHVMLAVLIMAAALAQVYGRPATSAYGGFWPHPPMPLLLLTASVVGFLLVRLLLDRRAGATLYLAADLGLAVNTVGRAYRELEEDGLIETRGRAGSFVSAAGEEGRERARQAAADYAAVIASVGIDTGEAIRIVQAALTPGGAASASV
ncbi:hypothetical protein [Streptosporangium sp. NPDC049644]|uniref:GntR family transcriptional regulator n=1 Tax=Streptosporangium sp. NPDC049644 TaxID=3155507 RepID=UPI00341DF77E